MFFFSSRRRHTRLAWLEFRRVLFRSALILTSLKVLERMGAPFGTACYFDYCFFLEATLYFTHLLTKSSSYPKANTTERHLPLFEAICSMWLHIHPLYFSFCSWRIFPCFFALPRFLLPTFGVRLTVTFGIAFGGILMTCPIQVYLLYLICAIDRKSTRLNSSHANISYAVFCLKKKKQHQFNRAFTY